MDHILTVCNEHLEYFLPPLSYFKQHCHTHQCARISSNPKAGVALTSFSQFQSSLFPNTCVGSCHNDSLPGYGGLAGTSPTSDIVPEGEKQLNEFSLPHAWNYDLGLTTLLSSHLPPKHQNTWYSYHGLSKDYT